MIDRMYADLIFKILTFGKDSEGRNGVVKKIFHHTFEINSTPLISVRRTAWKNAIREFEWFMSGSDKIEDLHPSVHSWWKPWANSRGRVLNNYSKQFRRFEGTYQNIDQIRYLQKLLKQEPQSRRMVISTWNTADMAHPMTPITNCHGSLIVADVCPKTNELSLSITQRSCDVMLGLPHNLIQYWAFLKYLASQSGMVTGKMFYTLENAHIYLPHIETAKSVLNYDLSKINTPVLTYWKTSDMFKADDFKLEGEYSFLIKENLKLIV